MRKDIKIQGHVTYKPSVSYDSEVPVPVCNTSVVMPIAWAYDLHGFLVWVWIGRYSNLGRIPYTTTDSAVPLLPTTWTLCLA